jgi:sialidase-1
MVQARVYGIFLVGFCLSTLVSEASGKRYDIVVGGKLTNNARIVGRTKPQGDRADKGSFVFAGLHNFVYAGAGFTSPNARIYAKLSINKFGGTGAGMIVNHHCLGFDMKPENRLFGTGKAFGEKTKGFAKASDFITENKPFEMEIVIKDGTLTYSINGKKVASADNFPAAWTQHPPETGKGHKLQLIASLRPWRATMKLYDFHVETEGELIPLPKTQAIYRSGSKGTHTYRIPAIVVSKKKTLLAFAEARRDGGHDTCDIDTVVRRSTDGGKTWGPEIIVFDDKKNVAGNPCPVVDQSTGRIWSLQTWNSNKFSEHRIKAGFGQDSRRVFAIYSDDDGITWSQAKEITPSVKLKHWSWYATGPGAGIQLQRGKHKGRLIIPCDHKSIPKGGAQTYHSHIVYSDDHGKTWKIGAETGHGLNECEAVELEDGSLMLNSRNHGVNKFYRGVSISKDGGETFSAFRRDPMLLEPRCQALIRRARWASDAKPGIILFSNPAWKWRTFMMLRMSYDDGKTWPTARVIYPGTSAYSDVAALPDGRVAVLFEKDYYRSINLAILPAITE